EIRLEKSQKSKPVLQEIITGLSGRLSSAGRTCEEKLSFGRRPLYQIINRPPDPTLGSGVLYCSGLSSGPPAFTSAHVRSVHGQFFRSGRRRQDGMQSGL